MIVIAIECHLDEIAVDRLVAASELGLNQLWLQSLIWFFFVRPPTRNASMVEGLFFRHDTHREYGGHIKVFKFSLTGA